MYTNKLLLERVDYLLELANKAISTKYTTKDSIFTYTWVSSESFKEFETASLSFILNLYGEAHPYFTRFKETVKQNKLVLVEAGKGILNSIKVEIEKGWLITIKGLVSAEIFSDYLDTAEYLLQQNYKDAAAVIIGSTLEENLRQLSRKNNISTDEIKNGKTVPKKADSLNNELYVAEVYNKLDQKNITAWLDLRNHAAHGHYSEYQPEQVATMLKGVMEFISRTNQ